MVHFLRQRVGSRLEEQATDVVGDYGWGGVSWKYKIPMLEVAEVQELQALLAPCFAPAPDFDIIRALSKIRVMTAGPNKSAPKEFEFWMECIIEELQVYPGDIVLEALADMTRTAKWMPSLAELLDRIKPEAQQRLAIAQAIHLAPPQSQRG